MKNCNSNDEIEATKEAIVNIVLWYG